MNASSRLCDLSDVERVHLLPDSVPLTSSEAALFLRISVSTLERMRRNGSGPAYSQSGEVGAKGSNQKCVYLKADLQEYLQARRVNSSMEAAVRKGQMGRIPAPRPMFHKLEDLGIKRAFHLNAKGKLDADVESLPVDTVIDRIGGWNIVWMNAVEAASAEWTWPSKKRDFAQEVMPVLERTLSAVNRYELIDT
jgi:hypothetical protein